MPLRNLPIKTGHLFLGLAAIMFIVTVSIFSGGQKAPEPVKTVPAKIETSNVVVPMVPISEGKTISMNDVTAVKWPKEFLPEGTTFADPYQLVGRVAKQDLFPGEPIFVHKVSGSDTNGGLPAVIPQGMRAVTVAVTEVKGVAGFVKPGDRVDILTTFDVKQAGTSDTMRVTRTVLQNVLVLASAQTMVDENKYSIDTPDGVTRGEATAKPADEKAAEGEKTPEQIDKEKEALQREKEKKDAERAARLVSSVTFALTPEQAEKLALAEETGDIRLSLRPETDHATAEVPGITFDQLLNRSSMSVAAPPPPTASMPAPTAILGTQVEFIQGDNKEIYDF